MKKSVYLILLVFLVQLAQAAGKRQTTEEYIAKYSDIAVREMKKHGIPASITLAQGILESDAGNSRLATKANNHFGIKKHDWTGPTVTHDDDKKREHFRKYRNAEESFKDHSEFLVTKERYSDLFTLKTNDYKAWAKGLKKAGYATNPHYATLLINLIERYELYKFDNVSSIRSVKSKFATDRTIYVNNHVKYIIVEGGDSFESLANKFGMRQWELPAYNNLPSDYELVAGDILYVRNKRSLSEKSIKFHRVQEGESLRDISQMYGVRIKSILRKNRMEIGEQIKVGQVLFLRYKKPKGMIVK